MDFSIHNSELRVSPLDLKNLRDSGLSDETIKANGLYTEKDPGKLNHLLRRGRGSNPCDTPVLVFRYRRLNGITNCYARVRPSNPRNVDGKPVKYESPSDEPPRPYFPAASCPLLRDPLRPIFITEGEKKALALSQLGLAAIGLGGFYGWKEKDRERLIEWLGEILWKGRVVYIVFDYDRKPETRRDAKASANRLARVLVEAAAVYWIELPPGPDGAKNGVDDFLVTAGQGIKGIRELVSNAERIDIKGIRELVSSLDTPEVRDEILHGPIGSFLRAVDQYTEAPMMGILAHLLPAIGTLIGPNVYVEKGNRHPTRVNSVVVGPTNRARKGTAGWLTDETFRQVDAKFWKEQRLKGLSSGEGLIAMVGQDEKYNPKTKLTDTIEREKRLYVVEPEFSSVFANKRREGNILSQIIRDAFDSGDLHTLTVKPRHAYGAHVSITGHITSEELDACLTDVDRANGFGNRFLWFLVKSDKIYPDIETIPDEVFNLLLPHLKALKALGDAKAEVRVGMDSDATEEWRRVYSERLALDQPGLGLAESMCSRGATMVLRLALIYACLDAKIKRLPLSSVYYVLNPESIAISLPHLQAAIAVWDCCEQSAYALFGRESGAEKIEARILSIIREHGGRAGTKEITSRFSPVTKREAGTTLEAMGKRGLICSEKEETGRAGRPTVWWSLPRN